MSCALKLPQRRTFGRFAWTIAMLIGAALMLSSSGAQTLPPVPGNGQQSRRLPPPRDPEMDERIGAPATNIFYEKRIQMLNAEQHRSMVADTDRLVKLVADLNAQIASSKVSTLTPEQLRTVAEIEKLAHNVRDKMRMSVRNAGINGTSDAPFAPR
jgi:hypothetical protein